MEHRRSRPACHLAWQTLVRARCGRRVRPCHQNRWRLRCGRCARPRRGPTVSRYARRGSAQHRNTWALAGRPQRGGACRRECDDGGGTQSFRDLPRRRAQGVDMESEGGRLSGPGRDPCRVGRLGGTARSRRSPTLARRSRSGSRWTRHRPNEGASGPRINASIRLEIYCAGSRSCATVQSAS